jgi:hypothetical protein
MLEKNEREKKREIQIEREFTMSFILFSSKTKKKTIIYELTSFCFFSHQLLDFTKEIFLNTWNIYTFIIALFILNSTTSGKYFYSLFWKKGL